MADEVIQGTEIVEVPPVVALAVVEEIPAVVADLPEVALAVVVDLPEAVSQGVVEIPAAAGDLPVVVIPVIFSAGSIEMEMGYSIPMSNKVRPNF